ncbi:hypothetical protein [Accumulibacter sp.]|uniref:hypothetical protein n=1 Tax=Accumulibacter sp. TaxID=2053492 RepID=UPI0025E6EC19|nr:hypothetical protein [Accumulibacter sp.]MCM8641538.1 hypothetical protein [Accumulibacter sp.]
MKFRQAGLTGVAGCLWIIFGLYFCAAGLGLYYDKPFFQRMTPAQQWYEILFYGGLELGFTGMLIAYGGTICVWGFNAVRLKLKEYVVPCWNVGVMGAIVMLFGELLYDPPRIAVFYFYKTAFLISVASVVLALIDRNRYARARNECFSSKEA